MRKLLPLLAKMNQEDRNLILFMAGRVSKKAASKQDETRFERRCLSVEITSLATDVSPLVLRSIRLSSPARCCILPSRSLSLEAANDPIAHCTRLAVLQHRSRHTGHRPAYYRGVVHRFLWGPQLEPWPFERTRKAHLAVAPHRQRNGASMNSIVSRRSAGHRRASRHRLSAAACCPTNHCCSKRCNSQCCGSVRPGSAHGATACDSAASRPAGDPSHA